MSKLPYRSAALVYLLLFIVLIWPFWFCGNVVAPHRQYAELAVADQNGAAALENRKFSDFTNGYIPEVAEHLNGSRSGWLTLWTNNNELGRPVYQISGFSPAYMPSWVISLFADNPWRFITVLSLATCFLAGLFILLFAREIDLHPIAGLIAGSSLAASPLFMYWLTFPMFPAVWCWSAGALWALTRLAKSADIMAWSVLAFSGYSLLMTAYPQPVVFHAYLLGAYGVWLVYQRFRINWHAGFRVLALAVSALIVGVALALPVYRDLAILYSESARVAPEPSFFAVVLPKFANLAEVVRFFVVGTVPELFGNPIAPSFPFPYDGLSVTLIVVFFAVIALFSAFRKTAGWWLAIAVLCLLAFVHPLYVLGIKYLGFNLSRSNPLGSIMLPLTVITAFGVDALLKRTRPGELAAVTAVAAACGLAVIAVGLLYGLAQDVSIRWGMVMAMLLVAGLLAAQYRQTRPVLLVLALVTGLATISYPLMLRQDPAEIAVTSPLIEALRKNLPEGSRFAVAAPGISVLPPNLNAALGLASVHSYNSLSSRRYHELIRELGGDMQTYGRSNGTIDPDYGSTMFWMSNIGLMLSPVRLEHQNLHYLGIESGIQLYSVVSRMGDSLQVIPPVLDMSAKVLDIRDPRLLPRYTPDKLADEGDVLEFQVRPTAPSVLILSRKFHRDWRALAFTRGAWQTADTVEIDGVFQGVLLPAGAQRVRLDFKPFARYAWIAHLFWLLVLGVLAFRWWHNGRHRALERV